MMRSWSGRPRSYECSWKVMVDLLELLGTYVGWIYGEDGGGMVGGDRGVCYESICMT